MYNKTMVILDNAFDKLKGTPSPDETANDVAGRVSDAMSSWDSFIQMIGLIILLILILAATYYTTKFVGGMKLGQMKNSNFKVIDAYRISPNKVMQIVKIGNKYIVIAISKDTINYITELDEAELFIREEQTAEKLSFKETFDKLRNMNK